MDENFGLTTMTIIPTEFAYQASSSLNGWLWKLWLCFPNINVIRAKIYYTILRFFGEMKSPSSFRLPFGIYVKTLISPEEALATEFVRRRTTIPVPKVLDVLHYAVSPYRSTMMVTKEIPGTPLSEMADTFNLNSATAEQKESFKNTLFNWLRQLRSISPPDSLRVCGFLGYDLCSYRISTSTRVGPFSSPSELHAQGFCEARVDYPDIAEDPLRIQKLIDERPNKKYSICLTHGDILPHNILVDETGQPCGLVDWECASWMPEYWEHTYALRILLNRYKGWTAMWRSMFPEYEDDLALEIRTWKWYDP